MKDLVLLALRRANGWLIRRTGYKFAPAGGAFAARRFVSDPREVAYYEHGDYRACWIHAPTAMGLAFNAFTLADKSYHPWVLAMRHIDQDERRARTVLQTYYSIVKPTSLAHWLDVAPNACPGLSALPVHAWSVLPWSAEDADEVVHRVEVALRTENRLHGLDAGISAGAKAFGPVSAEKLRVEVERLTRLFQSIKQSGLDDQRPDYDLSAVCLVANRAWRWLSIGGMHRVAVCAALGVSHIPMRVASVVRRDEINFWPQVVSGLYDRKSALKLFDRLFEGRPPSCAMPWIEWVDREKLLSRSKDL